MSTKPPHRQDSIGTSRGNDPRPNYIFLGTDTNGSDHVYRTVDETVVVITSDGDREHVHELDGRSAHEWVAHVGDVRGWDTQYLVESFADFLDSAGDA